MRKILPAFFAFFLVSLVLVAQTYPPVGMTIDQKLGFSGSTVDVSVRADQNFSNITVLNGTIVWDTSIITFNSVTYSGFSNPLGSVFNTSQAVNGILTYNYSSFITIGTYKNQGDSIFTLRFNVVGNNGQVSPVAFSSTPTSESWANGFGWQGTNFTNSNGSVTVGCGAPQVAFTGTGNLLAWNFTNGSTSGGGGTTYFWDFGDGNTSTTMSPTHTYASSGNYSVCLVVSDSCGSDSVCTSYNVCPVPGAGFGNSVNNLTATFTDQSTDSPTSWFWDFGDGNTSTLQNPTHTYAANANYTVCLTSTNACGSDSSCSTVVICPLPQTGFTNAASGLSVSFSDQSSGGATSWSWDFGDGNSSSLQNPIYIYSNPGTYNVCLTSTNSCGTNLACSTITVSCAAPVVTFSSSSTNLAVQFTDQSTNSPSSWSWDFGDGNTDTTQSPSHTYINAGTYTVCLVASSVCGVDTLCQSITVDCLTPVSGFSSVNNQLTVQFTDNSTNSPLSWDWDFGDGNTDNTQNPSHTYASDGTYTVCLKTSNVCGADSTCDTVAVMVVGIRNGIDSKVIVYPNPVLGEVANIESVNDPILRVKLFSLTGQVLAEEKGRGEQKISLAVSGHKAGLYFLEIETLAGKSVQKIILE